VKKLLSSLVFLFLPVLAYGQVIVGDAVMQAEVTQAKATLDKAKPKVLQLATGEFEVVEPSKTLNTPLLWLPTNAAIVERVEIAANEAHSHWGKRRGEIKAKQHRFAPKPYPWCILIGGDTAGSSTVSIIKNNPEPAKGPPLVVDTLVVTVGDAPNDDDNNKPPKVDDELTKVLREKFAVDLLKGKADKQWCKVLSKMYLSLSKDDLSAVTDVESLDTFLTNTRKGLGVPEPDDMLLNVRTVLRDEMYKVLGVNTGTVNLGKVPVNVDAKRQLKVLFAKMATSLGVIGS
jgi:hypothetical protein